MNKYIFFLAMLMTFSLYAQPEFTEHPVLADGVQSDPYFGDIDGDGDIDIITKSYDSYIGWFENLDGAGNFAPMVLLMEIDENTSTININDFDNDGDADILTTESTNNVITWYENISGSGDFGERQILIQDVERPTQTKLIDLDQDGDLDIIGYELTNSVLFWYENTDGQGTVGSMNILFSSNLSIQQYLVEDMDNDGDFDIALSFYWTTSWIENIGGQANFAPEQIISTSSLNYASSGICLLDIDNDNDLDIVTSFKEALIWNANLGGQNGFGPDQIIQEHDIISSSLYAYDFDNDGDDDLLSLLTSNEVNDLQWFENIDGSEDLANPQEIADVYNLRNVYLADFDADGVTEILTVASSFQELLIWQKAENLPVNYETPIPLETVSVTGTITPPLASDLDGDGDLDILFASQIRQIAWSKNLDGLGTFENTQVIDNGREITSDLEAADLDNDGDMDVIAATKNSNFWQIIVYENLDGLGNFGPGQPIASNINQINRVKVVDLDNDGDLDLISGANGEPLSVAQGKIYYHLNEGDLAFEARQVISDSRNRVNNIGIGDFNQDGLTDLVVFSYTEGGGTSFTEFINNEISNPWTSISILNSGNGSFTTESSISINDVDTDGDLDLILSSRPSLNDNNIGWFENSDGLGDFLTENQVANTNDRYSHITCGDIDNDGDVDVLSVNSYFASSLNEISMNENINGQGEFSEKEILLTFEDATITSISLADVDNDGSLDIILSSPSSIKWYKSNAIAKNRILGDLKVDLNEDDCVSSQVAMPNQLITTNDGVDTMATFSATANGSFQLNTFEGNFTTSAANSIPYYTVNPSSVTSSFTELNNTDTIHFCYHIDQEVSDLSVQLVPVTEARAGFSSRYDLVYQNRGSIIQNGTLTLEFEDTKMELLESSETPIVMSNGILEFAVDDLGLFEIHRIELEMQILPPPAVNFGESLFLSTHIEPVNVDINEIDNLFELEQLVIGAYDPNDISVREGTEILSEETDEYLHYLIRFQNTGNAEAINVLVNNKLDYHLDPQTLELEGLSHDYRVEISNNNDISFIFDNIYLPDSTSDEAASHGYISYRIKPISGIEVGDSIQNMADIYFDFNEPIHTNIVTTKVVEPATPVITYNEQTSCGPFTWIDGNTYTENMDSLVFVFTGGATSGADSIIILDLSIITVDTEVSLFENTLTAIADNASYQWVDCDTGLPVDSETTISFTPESNGNYAVDITQNGCTKRSACTSIILVNTKEDYVSFNLSIIPNPFQKSTTFKIGAISDDRGNLNIYDVNGISVFNQSVISNTDVIFRALDLPHGIYFYEINTQDQTQVVTGKVIKF